MKTKKPCVIFDLDGTISDPAHRINYIRSSPKNWKAFENALINDPPIPPVVKVFECIADSSYMSIIIVTARPERCREATTKWLFDSNMLSKIEKIYMRKDNDYRSDDIVKEEILNEIKEFYVPKFVFDDRAGVVDMWRRNGIYVFDCNQTREIF